jgi:hypothetical protein
MVDGDPACQPALSASVGPSVTPGYVSAGAKDTTRQLEGGSRENCAGHYARQRSVHSILRIMSVIQFMLIQVCGRSGPGFVAFR